MPIPTPPLTLGIEEEYQIINPKTHNLYAYISHLLSQDEEEPERINIKPEFMQSQVEVGSHICQNVQEIRGELVRLRRQVVQMAERNGLAIAAASTHPFGRWEEQSITEGVRYRELLDDMQGLARQLLIFGMHVHVGFGHENNPELKNLMIEIMNQSRYFIPHLLALSTSSPFWHGTNTGLKSYRSVIFEMLPRTGIPHSFDSWAEYVGFTKTMDAVGAFGKRDKVAKIWWDIRPHPVFDTMEFRIADICTSLDDAVCLAGLLQAICAKLIKLRCHNMAWRHYRHMHISENKWRAVRFGINGELIDFGREESVPFPVLAEELLEFVDDVLDELDSRQEVEHVRTIPERGTSADRQIATYEANGGDDNREAALNAVVDFLIAETKAGLS